MDESDSGVYFDEHQIDLSETQKQVILEYFYVGKTKDEISRNIKINKDSINFAFRAFRKCLRIKQKCNKSLLNKKTKLKDSHLEFIESLI